MKNIERNYHLELTQRIKLLKLESQKQEEEIKVLFNEIKNDLNPITIVKESISKLRADNEIKIDLAKLAINVGTNYAIDKFFKKNKGIKYYLLSMFIYQFPNSIISKMVNQIQIKSINN